MNFSKNDGPTYRADRATVLEALEARLALSGMETVLPMAMPEGAMVASGQSPAMLVAAEPDAAIDLDVRGPGGGGGGGSGGGGGGGNKPPPTLGNNLSFPVVWAEGAATAKNLRGTFLAPDLQPVDLWAEYTLDGQVVVQYLGDGSQVPDNATNITHIYQQQGPSTWQAETIVPTAPVIVEKLDWGDNLESVDWYTRSKVRTEVVLTNAFATPLVAYEMKHLSGWGIDELWGVATQNGQPAQVVYDIDTVPEATIYSHDARMTIQRLKVDRDDPQLDRLTWDPIDGHWEDPIDGTLINAPLLNSIVREAGDGPAYFSAEVNVKGKVIYGYTWDVRSLNEGAGDYRLTFSLDGTNYSDLNTFFEEGTTQIVVPEEEEESFAVIEGESPDVGATAQLDCDNNLTYIDIRILQRGGGGGGQPDRVKKPKVKSTEPSVAAALATIDVIGHQDPMKYQDQIADQNMVKDRRAQTVFLGECEPMVADQLMLQLRDQDRLRDCIDDTPIALSGFPAALAVDQAFAAHAELFAVGV